MFSEIVYAIIELGLPVAALSWLLFYRLYSHGVLARDADRKAIDERLKAIRKGEKESGQRSDSVLHTKWMKFGGGFYGVAAVWTLIFIEASGIVGIVLHPSLVADMFRKGIVHFITQQISSQITTFVDAAIWFTWWPMKGHDLLMWIAVAYVGYIAGLNLARYETRFGSRVVELDSRARWRSLVPFYKKQLQVSDEDAKRVDPPRL